MATRIILDNGGGIILQLGDWAHSYDGSNNAAIAKRAADDIREWLKAGTTKGWEGHDADALAVDPAGSPIGSSRVIYIDRDSDTAASLADEVRWGAMGEALGDALATQATTTTIEDSQTEEAVSRDYVLHLVASAPSHGDRHVDPDTTACELGAYASRDEAHRAGRVYLREHAGAWLQVSGVGSIDDVTLE